MKLWVDSKEPMSSDYTWCKSVNEAKQAIEASEADCKYHWRKYGYISSRMQIVLIDIGYSAGEYAQAGGDYVNLLKWLEKRKRNYQIRIHTENPAAIAELRTIIQRNSWREMYAVPVDLSRCRKCIHEVVCPKDKDKQGKCPHYKKDAPDGGYYG